MNKLPEPDEPGRPDRDLREAINSESAADGRFVVERLYDELRGIARRYMRRERNDHTLQPTELVNEACLKLLQVSELDDLTTRRFLGFGARAMRQVLVDHARQAAAEKRGGDWLRVTMQHLADPTSKGQGISVQSLDAALSALEATDPALAELTELHYFGGLTGLQLAERFSISRANVNRQLSLARALLLDEIDRVETAGEE